MLRSTASPPRLLVFGQTGQVARSLALRDAVQGRCNFLSRCDVELTHAQQIEAAVVDHDCDVVVNAAAYTNVAQAEVEPEHAYMVNAIAPEIMAKACARVGKPFVHLSTDYVFDGSGHNAWRPSDMAAPLNTYGHSKRAGEIAVMQAGACSVILRCAWVFSPFGSNFVTKILDNAAKGRALRVVNDQIGGPTPAMAVADAVMKISESLLAAPERCGVYHITGRPFVNRAAFARCILRGAGLPARLCEVATSESGDTVRRPLNTRLDCHDTFRAFGVLSPDWRPALADVLRDARLAA